MLIALANAHGNHHTIGKRAQRQPGDGPHFNTSEQHRGSDIQRTCFWCFNHNTQTIEVTRVGNGGFLQLKITARITASGFNVDIRLQDCIQMLHARCRNLWGDHRETGTASRKGLHVFRVQNRFCLNFVTGGDQLKRLDLADIDSQVANRHACSEFTGIERMQRYLAADRTRCGFRSIQNTLVTFALAGAGTA